MPDPEQGFTGTDPITGGPACLRETAKDLVKAQIVLGKLLDQYMPIADWDESTRQGFESYVRRRSGPR